MRTTLRDMRHAGSAARQAPARPAGALSHRLLAAACRHIEGLTHANP